MMGASASKKESKDDQKPPPPGSYPSQATYPGQSYPGQSYPGQQQPQMMAQPPMNEPPPPYQPVQQTMVGAQPPPLQQPQQQYVQQPMQFNYQGQQVAAVGGYDPSARFGKGATYNVPPPPPGTMPTAAQIASMQGQQVYMNQEKKGWFEGHGDGGSTLW